MTLHTDAQLGRQLQNHLRLCSSFCESTTYCSKDTITCQRSFHLSAIFAATPPNFGQKFYKVDIPSTFLNKPDCKAAKQIISLYLINDLAHWQVLVDTFRTMTWGYAAVVIMTIVQNPSPPCCRIVHPDLFSYSQWNSPLSVVRICTSWVKLQITLKFLFSNGTAFLWLLRQHFEHVWESATHWVWVLGPWKCGLQF